MLQDTTEFKLAKTGLCVHDGCLIKQSPDGQAIARHALADIQRVELTWRWDVWATVFSMTFAALAFVAWRYIPWAGWRWVAVVVLGALACLSISIIRQPNLCVQLRHGSVLYPIDDDIENGQGFALSLMAMVERCNPDSDKEALASNREARQ